MTALRWVWNHGWLRRATAVLLVLALAGAIVNAAAGQLLWALASLLGVILTVLMLQLDRQDETIRQQQELIELQSNVLDQLAGPHDGGQVPR